MSKEIQLISKISYLKKLRFLTKLNIQKSKYTKHRKKLYNNGKVKPYYKTYK